jgi:ATP-dependent DNA helicase RecG
MLTLYTPLSEVAGIGRFLPKLQKLGLKKVGDLLRHLPTRYEDLSKICLISDLVPGEFATIQAEVVSVDSRRSWHRKLFLMEAKLQDSEGNLVRATWFNQPYLKKLLPEGKVAHFAGKVAQNKKTGEPYLLNPSFENPERHTHTGRLVPIYPETRGLTSKGIRFVLEKVLSQPLELQEYLPKEILKEEKLPELQISFQNLHRPENEQQAEIAKRRFAFENLYFFQLRNIAARKRLQKFHAEKIPATPEILKELSSRLPFELTKDQKLALWDIARDLERGTPMNRLLQGEVGSGKTAVAGLSALLTAQAGLQTAFLAPTEILAKQHFRTFCRLFPNFEKGIVLITGSGASVFYGENLESDISKRQAADMLGEGKGLIAIGTHALIQKTVNFGNLGLVIVDEQHRFGVKQRAELIKKSKLGNQIPHLLSMTATPIPRTLSLTLYGDLDLSLIKELPRGRRPIKTLAVPPEKRRGAYEFIRQETTKGRQVFVVCPRIAPPEKDGQAPSFNELAKLEIKTVQEEYEKLRKNIFPELKIAQLHGRLKAAEKDKIMKDFSTGKIHILISTSVIEIGVDVPNASVMMIEGADRFGLAQLHQFRGRVGRGEHQSYCLLFTESHNPETLKRLNALSKTMSGFELAELDLQLRGPGQFLGEHQTGLPDLAMDALRNPELVAAARRHAVNTLEQDPKLTKHLAIKKLIGNLEAEVHWE